MIEFLTNLILGLSRLNFNEEVLNGTNASEREIVDWILEGNFSVIEINVKLII